MRYCVSSTFRGAVSERIASRGKTLLALTSNKVSLEQIFLRLTEAADNDEAKRLLGIEELPEENAQEEQINIEISEDDTVTVKSENDTKEDK